MLLVSESKANSGLFYSIMQWINLKIILYGFSTKGFIQFYTTKMEFYNNNEYKYHLNDRATLPTGPALIPGQFQGKQYISQAYCTRPIPSTAHYILVLVGLRSFSNAISLNPMPK